MPVLKIHMDGDECWPDLREKADQIIHLANESVIEIARLTGGMSSGKSSVCFRFDLPDGRIVLAETSLALFTTAADGFKAREEAEGN